MKMHAVAGTDREPYGIGGSPTMSKSSEAAAVVAGPLAGGDGKDCPRNRVEPFSFDGTMIQPEIGMSVSNFLAQFGPISV
jgi:hypothetical protein